MRNNANGFNVGVLVMGGDGNICLYLVCSGEQSIPLLKTLVTRINLTYNAFIQQYQAQ